jgi:hypothetical protein
LEPPLNRLWHEIYFEHEYNVKTLQIAQRFFWDSE